MRQRKSRRIITLLVAIALLLSLATTAYAQADEPDAAPQATVESTQSADAAEPQEGESTQPPEQSESPEDATEPEQEEQTAAEEPTATEEEPAEEIAAQADEGISAAATESSTVKVGESITLTGSTGSYHNWSSNNTSIATVSAGRNGSATVTGVKPGTVTITHSYRSGQRNVTETFEVTVKWGKTIEAKVYLRYSNEVPTNINAADIAANYGPAGDDTPYITVTVDLDKVEEKLADYNAAHQNNQVSLFVNDDGFKYYSIDSTSNKISDTKDRLDAAKDFYKKVIYPAIKQDDQAALDAIFGGEGAYIGYVLKIESYDWHIDGVLTNDPPVHVVELYDADNNNKPRFAISGANGQEVTLEQFETQVAKTLDVDKGNCTFDVANDKITVTYADKDSNIVEVVITPFTGDQYNSKYGINVSGDAFDYREVTKDVFYLCRLQMTKPEVTTGALTLSKTVTGGAANPDEHFVFTLENSSLAGKEYSATYAGVDSSDTRHGSSVAFNNLGNATVSLKHGETVTILGLPDTEITITEVVSTAPNPNNYGISATVDSKEATVGGDDENQVTANITAGKTTDVAFTNKLDPPSQTGISMDDLPFIIIGACVLAGACALFLRRKKHAEF